MKANELRIGNYVNIDYCVQQIELIGCGLLDMDNLDDTASYIFLDNENLEPIPLTEEWLLKFGIEKHLDYWYLELKNKFETVYLIQRENIFYYGHGNWSTKLKHVHQLQNLYFALTGEELTIKETVK